MKILNTSIQSLVYKILTHYAKGTEFKENEYWIWPSQNYSHKRVRLSPPITELQKILGTWFVSREILKPVLPNADCWESVWCTGAPMLMKRGISDLHSQLADASSWLSKKS